jgi:hypothetical protein
MALVYDKEWLTFPKPGGVGHIRFFANSPSDDLIHVGRVHFDAYTVVGGQRQDWSDNWTFEGPNPMMTGRRTFRDSHFNPVYLDLS